VVLHAGLGWGELEARSAPLRAAGASIRAQLVSFRSFLIKVEEAQDTAALGELLAGVLGIPVGEVRTCLSRLPHTFAQPLGDTRARWLLAELRARGARASLEAP
jgi:hypothetical protein